MLPEFKIKDDSSQIIIHSNIKSTDSTTINTETHSLKIENHKDVEDVYARIKNVCKLNEKSNEWHLRFNKILCDVPCSGDGAIRKIPNKWRDFTARDGYVLSPLQ